jgi:hypothetical protein
VSLDLIEVIGMEVALTAVGKRIARAGINSTKVNSVNNDEARLLGAGA